MIRSRPRPHLSHHDLVYGNVRSLATALAAGELSALDLLEAHLARLQAVNPILNAVVSLDLDRARARAREADEAQRRGESWGPLHGLPFTVKDTFSTIGMPTTIGVSWIEHRPEHDAVLVRRLREAGAVLFGKTNCPFGSYDWQCRDSRFGVCNNPYDPKRVPGGSSSGSAAAVAAGITPFELGSDVAGSIRQPAAFCGIAGLRPTEGLLDPSGHGELPNTPHNQRLVTCGPMARSVDDLEILLPILAEAGHAGHSIASAPLPPAPASIEISTLRLAWSASLAGIDPAAEVRARMEDFRLRLSAAGATVHETAPPIDLHEGMAVWGLINGAELITMYPAAIRWFPWLLRTGLVGMHFGRGHFSRALARGYTSGMRAYMQAQTRRDELVARGEAFLGKYDAWICPVAPITAFTHRKTGTPLEIDDRRHCYADTLGLYNCPITLLGAPVVTIPIGRDGAGMPIGIQIVGHRFSDARLLAVARELEGIAGGFVRPAID